MPLMEMTAMSVVPPPMSTTMFPKGSSIGRPAPIAAAKACSTRYTSLARARYAESSTARFSVRQHLFRNFEIRYHAVFHRLDGHHVSRRPPQHLFCFPAYGDHFAIHLVDRHNRRFVHHDAFAV